LAAPRPEMFAWAVEMEMRGVRERIKARRKGSKK
jgi:hypothetical protein